MKDWNAVVTIHERRLKHSFNILEEFGPIVKSNFFNVLLMKVENIDEMMAKFQQRMDEDPDIMSSIARVAPLRDTFNFSSPEEFEQKAMEAVKKRANDVAGKGFHVRIHRRGFKGKISSMKEEQFLDHSLLEAAEKTGRPAHVTFDNPDAIVEIEIVGQRGGLSLWTREDLERYPFLKPD